MFSDNLHLFIYFLFSHLAWMRRNCMHIFHYLTDQLKDTPNFASANIEESESSGGAIYNDYEFATRKLSQCRITKK